MNDIKKIAEKNAGWALAAIFAISVVSLSFFSAGAAHSSQLIGPVKANELIKKGKVDLILDVRTVNEYYGRYGHLKNSILIPDFDLPGKISEIEQFKDKTVLVYCHSGVRSDSVSGILKENGFKNVLDLDGGIAKWKESGLITVK